MPVSTASFVGPADLRVRKDRGLLTCVGLRTGACLCLYDPFAKVAGMAHITDATATVLSPNRPGKYSSSAVEALVQSMERAGALRSRIVAVVIGGAEVTVRDPKEDDGLVLDSGVCRAVELELRRSGLPLQATDIGGKEDRSVMFDACLGSVRVKKGEADESLCQLSIPSRAVAA